MIARKLLLGMTLLVGLPLNTAAASGDSGEDMSAELVEMEAIAVPIIDGSRVEGTLHFRVVLQPADSAAAENLSRNLPMLRAEALSAGSEFSRLSASPFLAIDARGLASELTDALRASDAGIARVLLVEVAAKP